MVSGPVNPLTGVRVASVCAVCPCRIVTAVGVRAIENPGWTICSGTITEVEPAKFVSPEYTAVIGCVDAVEYTPANPSAPKLRVYWYGRAPSKETGPHAHLGGFYDGKGQQPYHGGWRTPVPLARIASRFNPRRMHPVLHVIMPHNGVDFAAPPGTPVYASASGTVKTAGDGGPCGNMVQIQHTAGLVSSYCHMSRFAAGIHVGQHVDQRQLVGYVGQTGRATGPHLHFAIKRGDVFLDPLAFKLDGVRVLPPSLRDDFAKERVEMDLALEAIPMPAAGDGGAASGAGTADGGAAPDETVFDDSPGLE